MIIDFSAHYLTPEVAKILDETGREPWPAETVTVEDRLKTMSKYGVDMQVLSLTTPYLLGINPKNAAKACKASNDSIQKVIEKYPDKFTGFAVISLLDVESALEELERAIKDLGLKGVALATNQNGVGLDSPTYIPFYDRVAKYDVPIFLHPTNWKSYPLVEDPKYGLMGLIGWYFDTTQAVCRLIFGKVLETHPTLKIVTHHLGAYLPVSRIRDDWVREELGLKKPIAEYFKQVYGDTAISGMGLIRKEILTLGYAFFGPQRTLFGTDSPFGAENGEAFIRDNLKGVMNMDIPKEEKQLILEKNAKKLLKIK
jgi:aminocarboxymuconate-semialdehyde decarboxylase